MHARQAAEASAAELLDQVAAARLVVAAVRQEARRCEAAAAAEAQTAQLVQERCAAVAEAEGRVDAAEAEAAAVAARVLQQASARAEAQQELVQAERSLAAARLRVPELEAQKAAAAAARDFARAAKLSADAKARPASPAPALRQPAPPTRPADFRSRAATLLSGSGGRGGVCRRAAGCAALEAARDGPGGGGAPAGAQQGRGRRRGRPHSRAGRPAAERGGVRGACSIPAPGHPACPCSGCLWAGGFSSGAAPLPTADHGQGAAAAPGCRLSGRPCGRGSSFAGGARGPAGRGSRPGGCWSQSPGPAWATKPRGARWRRLCR